jgi:two-component system, LytTR family, response regulator
MIHAIIVDDEEKSRVTLNNLISKHCPKVQVNELCNSVDTAIKAIERFNPDIVFLDIEMPFHSGFNLLERIKDPEFDVIFTTAYDHYAIKAVKFSAMDYLLKPIDVDELKEAVNKIGGKKKDSQNNYKKFELLLSNIKGKSVKIAVPTFDGLQMINADDIVRCVADESYTNIHLKGGQKIIVSKLLKEYEELLSGYNFFRIHNSTLVNLKHVSRYIKGEGGYVVMSDGENCEVARRKKTELLSRLSAVEL